MKSAVLLLLMAGVAFPLVVGYHVDPISANLSGWTHRGDSVSEIITVNFDEPITASLFCGAVGDSGAYHVSIRMYPGDLEIAYGDTASPRDHSWATCTLHVDFPDSFIKGRQIEVRWTRSASDSIMYYYQDGDPYKYGFLSASGSHAGQDLAMRCLGRMDTVDSTLFGATAILPWEVRDTWASRAREAGLE